MATITWGGKSGNWNAGTLWTGAIVPGAADVAEIDTSAGTDTILLNDSRSAGGVTLNGANATLQLTGTLDLGSGGILNAQSGTLVVAGTLVGGTLEPNGATVQFASVDPITTAIASPELDDVAVVGTLDISATPVTLQAIGLARASLTNIKIGAGSEIIALDGEIFDGQTIDLAGGVLADDAADPNNGSIFLGPSTTLIQNTPSTTARVGPDVVTAGFGLGQVTNEGTIIASAGTLLLDAEGGAFTSPFHRGPFTNTGAIQISGGATVVDDTDSTLPGLGSITNNGGLLDLRGTLDNTNTAIDVAATGEFSNLRLDDTVTGGTITEDGGSLVAGTAALNGVTVIGGGLGFDTLRLGAGTQFNPTSSSFTLTASDAAFGQLELGKGETLANATVNIGAAGFRGTISADPGGTATLDSSVIINVGSGQVMTLDSGTSGSMVNNAVINVAAGGRLEIDNAATYTAGGTINVVPGATVAFNGNIGPAGLKNVVGTGASLVNLGVLDLGGGTIATTGDANFSSFVNEGVITDGTLVTAAGENHNLGSIFGGGTLVTGPGLLPLNSVSFSNGTLKGAVNMDSGGDISIDGNTTLQASTGTGNGLIVLQAQPAIFVQGAATSFFINNNATISHATVLMSGVPRARVLDAFNSFFDITVQNGSTATFAPDTTIEATTVGGEVSGMGAVGVYINEGTFVVAPGADLFVGPFGLANTQQFINKGLVTIAAGGTFDVITRVSIASLGSIVGPGGLLRFDAPDNSNINNYDNTGTTLTVGGPTGAPDLEINGTTINGGTIVNAGGNFTGIGGATLSTVTYVGPLHLTSGSNIFGTVSPGNLTFLGGTLQSQTVAIDPGGFLALGADQSFTGATLTLAGELADTGHTLGFDSATTVNITGAVFMPAQHILNNGTIIVGPGASLNFSDFGATGTPEAVATGTIILNDGTFSSLALNTGQVVDLRAGGVLSISSRFDPSSTVDFQGPATLSIGKGTTFQAAVQGFGAGDKIALTGFSDGLAGAPPSTPVVTTSFNSGSNTLDVLRTTGTGTAAVTTTIAAIPLGAGYVDAGFTLTPVGSTLDVGGGTILPLLITEYDVTYAAPGSTPPRPPAISGTVSKQPTTDLAAVTPFSGVDLTDLNAGAVITAFVSPSTLGNGTLTSPSGGTFTPSGATWVDSGTPAAVQADLRALVFTPTPHEVGPTQSVTTGFTIAVSDQTGSATDTATSVVATAVEDTLGISGAAPLVITNDSVNFAQPFHQLTITDPDNATFTATATLASLANASFGKSFNATISPSGVYSTSGDLATVQQALHDLIAFVTHPPLPTGQSVSTTMTMSLTDGVSQTISATSTIEIVASGTADAAGLNIVGATPGQTTTDQVPINPFSGAIIVDKSVGVLDTVTITSSDTTNGTFSDAVGGTINNGTFTASATVDSTGFVSGIDNALAGLVFTPARGQVPLGQAVTTDFTITASNSLGSTTDASTSVIVTSANGQLSIGGAQANQQFTDQTTVLPLSGVTVFDSSLNPTDTATATLSNPKLGTLIATNGGTVGIDGVFQVSGSLASVQAALRGINFVPSTLALGSVVSSGLTIAVVDGTLNASDNTTSLNIVGTGNAGSIAPNPAVAALVSSGPSLAAGTAAGNFVLNLGTVLVGATAAPVTLNALNTAAAPADSLSGGFSIDDPGGFINSGFAGFGTLAASGTTVAGTITLATGTAGTFSETITLAPTDLSGGGGVALPNQTVTVNAVVAPVLPAPAVEVLNFSGTIVLPNVRVGAVDRRAVSLSNGATAPANTLSVTPAASGQATAFGTISGLGAGATDTESILAGIDTSAAGARSGTVTLNGSSVDGGGTATPLAGPPVVSVSGNVYRTALGTIAPVAAIVHVGDPGTLALTVANTAAADGFSENLIANLATVPAGFTIASAGPTGDIAAGTSDAPTLALGFSTTAAGTIAGTATVGLTSDGGGVDGLGTVALAAMGVPVSVTVNNFANPVFESAAAVGTLTGGGTAFALNLGTIAQGTGAFTTGVDIRNLISGPADVLTGTLTASGSGAFTNSGLASIGTLGAGAADIAPAITLATDTPGTFSETIILTPAGSNAGGFSAALPAETLTVTGTVVPPLIPPAVASIVSATPIDFGAVHVGAAARQTLDIANAASAGSAALDASVSSTTGDVAASGSFTGLAPGADNASTIQVGIDTASAGAKNGAASLAFVSNGGTLGSAGLPGQTVAASGTVFREAAAALLPLTQIVHVGDPGTIVLPIANSDPNDGFSERLIATLLSTAGGLGIAASGPTEAIAAGSTDTAALALAFSTAAAGTIAGSATVGLVSDGGTGVGGIDGLGQTTLSAQTVPVTITVNNFATPVLTSGGNLTAQGANAFVLNLGTAARGSAALSAGLNIGNGATGAADLLNGTYSVSGSSQFSNTGFGAFGDLGAGGSITAGGVSLATNQAGVFTETITLTPTDRNASLFSRALTPDTITVTGTILQPAGAPPAGTATGDVHMLTFDGLRYDFQAIGGFVLARSTAPGNTFQIQIETAASPTIDAASVTVEAAAEVGSHTVSFAVGQGDTVWLDGAPDTTLLPAGPAQDLGGGRLEALSPTEFRLSWSSGETLTVTDPGPYLDDSVSLGPNDGPGSVRGLLGSDSGQDNDFQLADGTVLARPLSESALEGAFANAWRVTPAGSLLGDVPMQFMRDGSVVTQATSPGQVLSAGAGEDVLSDALGFGATFQGTLADLAAEAIEGFSGRDVIDVAGLDAASTRLAWLGTGTSGVLRVSDATHAGDLHLSGLMLGGPARVDSDGAGGVLIRFTP